MLVLLEWFCVLVGNVLSNALLAMIITTAFKVSFAIPFWSIFAAEILILAVLYAIEPKRLSAH